MAAEDYIFTKVETFIVLLFSAIIVGIVLTNPKGIEGFFNGLATLGSKTVSAFSGGQGFAGRAR